MQNKIVAIFALVALAACVSAFPGRHGATSYANVVSHGGLGGGYGNGYLNGGYGNEGYLNGAFGNGVYGNGVYAYGGDAQESENYIIMKSQLVLQMRIIMVLVACLTVNQVLAAADWSYSGELGPSTWKERYPTCGGMRQSPINIDTTRGVVAMHGSKMKIQWNNYNKAPVSMKLINNGHSVQLKATPKTGQSPYLQVNSRIYELDQIHFHWGKKDNEGSEHTFNSKRYPLELHAVHRRTVNGTQVSPAEIIVINLIFKISPLQLKNLGFERFVKYISQVKTAETEVAIPPFPADNVIPPFKHFLMYEGSLTTPPCSEVVTFVIRKELAWVSSNQLKLFRAALNEEGEELAGNFRPIQPTNNRTVYYVDNRFRF